MKYLIRVTEVYRVETESEAKALIEEAKKDHNYTVSKYSNEYRCTKSKGEIVDEWHRVTLIKDFTAEKEPDTTVSVFYDVQPGAFPNPVDAEDEE